MIEQVKYCDLVWEGLLDPQDHDTRKQGMQWLLGSIRAMKETDMVTSVCRSILFARSATGHLKSKEDKPSALFKSGANPGFEKAGRVL